MTESAGGAGLEEMIAEADRALACADRLFWDGTGIALQLVADHQDSVVRPVLFVRIRPEHGRAPAITAPPTSQGWPVSAETRA